MVLFSLRVLKSKTKAHPPTFKSRITFYWKAPFAYNSRSLSCLFGGESGYSDRTFAWLTESVRKQVGNLFFLAFILSACS